MKAKRMKLINILLSSVLIFISACGGSERDRALTLSIGNGAEPLTMDPAKATNSWENRMISGMFIGLTMRDAKGAIVPGMAESWTTSADGLTWTFKLRAANWSDGIPVTAGDFEYAARRLMTMKPPSQVASQYFALANAEAVQAGTLPPEALGVLALDPKTVQIKLKEPTPFLPILLAYMTLAPVPKHAVEKLGDAWVKPENIVVNGAYKLAEWKAGDFVHLTRNAGFWGNAGVCLNDLYYFPTTDTTAAERRVRAGELDWAVGFSGARLEEINKTMPGTARVTPAMRTSYIIFNQRKTPYTDARVRQALSMVVDREFLVDKVLRDGSLAGYGFVPPPIEGYPDDQVQVAWKNVPRAQRLEQARTLLTAAGFGPSNPLRFVYSHRSGGDIPKVVPVLQQNWRDIAPWVEVTLQAADSAIHYGNLTQGNFDVADASWGNTSGDVSENLALLETGAGSNDSGYSNKAYDAILTRARLTANIEQRTKLMLEAEAIALADNAVAPVWFDSTRDLVNPRVTGWEPNAYGAHLAQYMCTVEGKAGK
jgi:oligopeptide transport system substrate-binding protein